MSRKKLQPSQSYLLLFGATTLIIVRFLEKDFNEWGNIDYYIVAVCAGTIFFSILTLFKKNKNPIDNREI